jgi:hypothetical protein
MFIFSTALLDKKMVKKHLALCPLCGNDLEVERA